MIVHLISLSGSRGRFLNWDNKKREKSKIQAGEGNNRGNSFGVFFWRKHCRDFPSEVIASECRDYIFVSSIFAVRLFELEIKTPQLKR